MGEVASQSVDPSQVTEEQIQEQVTAEILGTDDTAQSFEMPEKFAGKTAEEIAQSYLELEKQLGSEPAKTEESVVNDDLTIKEEPDAPEPEEWNFQQYADEYAKSGELSEGSRKELTERGIPEEMVNQYVAGAAALARDYDRQILEAAGGKDEFESMANWVRANGQDSERQAFNQEIKSGDVERAKLAVAGMMARYRMSPQGHPGNLEGRPTDSPAIAPFRSTQERTMAMMDPRYDNDPAYRSDVDARIQASDLGDSRAL
tara:strand:- start:9104 stop:9883 length:780 start_codon:yes stop_codon:yes gene_type:complete